jgi:hypothetical protein
MGVVSIHSFRTEPGRLAEHTANSAEALEHLQRLGLQAMTMSPVAGTDVGTIATVVNYEDNAHHATSMVKVQGDSEWQKFWLRASSGGSATMVESSIYFDADPAWEPANDRPLGAMMATQWKAKDGRMAEFMSNVNSSLPHIKRLGGAPRVMMSMVGAHPMSVVVSVTFADLEAYGAYADALAGDAQWQEFWAGIGTDPTADLVRSGVYTVGAG